MVDIGRDGGVSARDRKPAKEPCERKRAGLRIRYLSSPGRAAVPRELREDCVPRLGIIRGGGASNEGKEIVEPCMPGRTRQEPVPAREELRVRLRESAARVGQELERRAGIEQRIVLLVPGKSRGLVVLDEPVIGIPGKCERAQVQGVDGLEAKERKTWIEPRENLEIVGDEVVPDDPPRAVAVGIQGLEVGRGDDLAVLDGERFGAVEANGAHCADERVAALEIE